MRIAFIHPDLGIGGAERLVVDAAVSLQRLGHEVVMFTSRHDPARCFIETKDGTLPVHVLGSSLPRILHPRFPCTILFSILRSLFLATLLLTSLLLPDPPSPFNPLSPLPKFDLYIVDQQSVAIPLLRFVSGSRVIFYCHFPDKLLSGGWDIRIDDKDSYVRRQSGVGLLKRLYRWPIDKLEQWTTGQADVLVSNSEFSSRVFQLAFPSLSQHPRRVIYPCIDIEAYQTKIEGKGRADGSVESIVSDRPTIISFNRFEAKKNVALAIKAFAGLRDRELVSPSEFADLRFVIGGGYDSDEQDNRQTLANLQSLCTSLGITYTTITNQSATQAPIDPKAQVIFLLNFTNAQRTHLLTSSSTLCLLYTPENEHFGIVPIEAAACGIPVLACTSGGPMETVVDFSRSENGQGSGLLRPPDAGEWTQALSELIHLPSSSRYSISSFSRYRAQQTFSLATLGGDLEEACEDALKMGDLHMQIGDKLIWGSLGLMAFAVGGLGVIWALGG
ncbi:hypothetical protein L202_02687 [Cryptococcus amylolentus CBS 6039]|uniref:Alpha-1,3/1,6-mannosyltransferase ALG2 n=2 Tax=Cryptococcus amylolentus TaxID=104669 RepID=A0A1E3HVV7_9TREE|nr:hypothetical protein L202_02687 [Cryptococcus amylolentus CBS 6039]ODN80447.1 hypothetical protein L202_02687 [Cryptococcus amylolentus CBS 6039]ODO09067.1 hypothetical protein I350_02666 [Cryptococcus amylolentus CBS 6273]